MTEGPVDPGLQVERTELAWRRTALAIALGSLLSLRVLPMAFPALSGWAFAPGTLGLVAACALWFAAHRRQIRFNAQLSGDADRPLGGGEMFALALFVFGFGLAAIIVTAIAVVSSQPL